MKHKLWIISFIPFLLISCQSNKDTVTPGTGSTSQKETETSSTDTTEYHISKKLDEAKVYVSTDKYVTMSTVFFTEYADVPYVELSEFFVNFFSRSLMENAPNFFDVSNGTVTNRFTDTSLIFDVKNNRLTTSDLDQFTNYNSSLKTPIDIVDSASNNLAKLNTEKCSYTKGKEITYDLNRYSLRLISHDGKIYAPFSVLENVVLSPIFMRMAFNGDDYYFVTTTGFIDSKTNELNDYGKMFYSGSLSKTRSKSYATYFYGSFLFEMENYNGHYPRLGITDLDKKLSELGLKEDLLSTESDYANSAMAKAINEIFHDGGHTAFYHRGMTSKFSAEKDSALQSMIINYDTRYVNTMMTYKTLHSLRKEEMSLVEISSSKETAVIHFDSFAAHTTPITKANVTVDTMSTFANLYNAFNELSKESSVKNVIFDISLNGGGAASALSEALSFMTDDPVEITVTNTQTGAVITEAIDFDNNLDGSTADNDSYSGKYNFYILTSEFSFSCGNAFPCIAKDKGYAKIIGHKSGGGDCAVIPSVSTDGGVWTMSSNYSITSNGKDVDDGKDVDISIDYTSFYDVDKLDKAIK